MRITSDVNRLRSYERHVACILSGILLSLSFVSMPKEISSCNATKQVLIHVVGAVRECSVSVPIGSTVDDVLQQVELSPKADILEINASKKFMANGTLVIPFDGKLTLYVIGAVTHPKVLVLDAPSSASEILQKVQLLDTADSSRFRRRRVFKTGMVIEIPEKQNRGEKIRGKAQRKNPKLRV